MKREFTDIVADYKSGDPALREKAMLDAIDSAEGFIMSIATKKYKSYMYKDADDILQCGRMAVIEALPGYDAEKGKPSTYFYFYIKGAIQNFINSNHNCNTIHFETANNKIRRAQMLLMREGRPIDSISDIELAELTKMPLSTVRTARMIKHVTSTLEFNDGKDENGDFLPSAEESNGNPLGESPEDVYVENERTEVIRKALEECLDDTERFVINGQYGLGPRGQMTIKAMAQELGISTSAVKTELSYAISKLANSNLAKYFNNYPSVDDYFKSDYDFFPKSNGGDIELVGDELDEIIWK